MTGGYLDITIEANDIKQMEAAPQIWERPGDKGEIIYEQAPFPGKLILRIVNLSGKTVTYEATVTSKEVQDVEAT